MTVHQPDLISLPSHIHRWATEHPDKSAIIFVPTEGPHQTISWGKLDTYSTQMARLLADKGVDDQSRVVVGLNNCPQLILTAIAAWKLGAMIIPIRNATPPVERNQILALAEPTVVITDWADVPYPVLTLDALKAAETYPTDPLPDIISNPGRAMASGGSTGRPKLIVENAPFGVPRESLLFERLHMNLGMVQLVSGALYHAAPFAWMYMGLYQAQTLVLTARFDPSQVADLIEQYKVNYAYMAPIMMSRLAKLPGIEQRDLSSIECMIHMAAPCPAWLKRQWNELIGPTNVLEVYAATEAGIVTDIWGDEWEDHPNSVGTPMPNYELKILDALGQELPAGEVGEIFIRKLDSEFAFEYVGSPPAKTAGNFTSIGDLGWLDEAGYLFIADRRVDMIITGGANVFPAEVEAALTEHSSIGDVAVIGLTDEEWGKRVHAVIQPLDDSNPPSMEELDAHCKERLMAYKVPKTYEFVEELPRTAAGKLRRSALIADREAKEA